MTGGPEQRHELEQLARIIRTGGSIRTAQAPREDKHRPDTPVEQRPRARWIMSLLEHLDDDGRLTTAIWNPIDKRLESEHVSDQWRAADHAWSCAIRNRARQILGHHGRKDKHIEAAALRRAAKQLREEWLETLDEIRRLAVSWYECPRRLITPPPGRLNTDSLGRAPDV